MGKRVLVVSTVEDADDVIRDELQAAQVDEVKVVVPAVRQGVLDWLANDERAFRHAQDVADQTAEALPGDTVEASAGEADVELAIRDALATFPADEILVAVRPPDDAGAIERAASEGVARDIDGVPVRKLVVRG